MGDFGARVATLADQVGRGDLQAMVTVDQVYAKYQHEGLDLKHPEGGQAKYLQQPLFAERDRYLRGLASAAITETGSDLEGAAVRVAEDLSTQVYQHAPFEFGDLRASGHPTVTSDGATVYDRLPLVPRLSESELRDKHHVHRLGLGH